MCANVLFGTLPAALLIWYAALLLNKSAPVPHSARLTNLWPTAYQTTDLLCLICNWDVCQIYGQSQIQKILIIVGKFNIAIHLRRIFLSL